MKKYIITILMVSACLYSLAQSIRGKVISTTDSTALPNVTIKLKTLDKTLLTDANGEFALAAIAGKYTISLSHIGFETKEMTIVTDGMRPIIIALRPLNNNLATVEISTGYQALPLERAAGSYTKINTDLLNRTFDNTVLRRLADNVPGLIFNKGQSSVGNEISIRGQSTIFSNANPLIVLDNFPYEGNIENINPDDIESITILKDAAATSIWGAKAGNGVIVITSKKGRANQTLLSFNSIINYGEKPNAFYRSQMSVADYIDTEIKLFNMGFYKSTETSIGKEPLSPVVELLIANRDGKINNAALADGLAEFKQDDLRNDLNNYLNRNSLNTQYSLNLSGGNSQSTYFISASYSRSLASEVGNGQSRFTLNANHSYSFLNKRLKVNTALFYANNQTDKNAVDVSRMSTTSAIYPYARLIDDAGNAAVLTKDYRVSFIENAKTAGLLDWSFNPIQELAIADNTVKTNTYNFNMTTDYEILKGLNAAVLYQYTAGNTNSSNLQSADSYFARNMVNRFTALSNNILTYPVPIGAINDRDYSVLTAHHARAQLSLNQYFGTKHHIDALAGIEVSDQQQNNQSTRVYGYDEFLGVGKVVDYKGAYPLYNNPGSVISIPSRDATGKLIDRYLSYFINAGYLFNDKYLLNASARLDESNLFGVATNQRGVPLWSVGAAWNMHRETFLKNDWLVLAKLRATYGYSGNVSKSITAYTTARYFDGQSSLSKLPYADITNPPNDELRWERVKMTNLGLDFSVKPFQLSGSLDFYSKRGIDLIGDIPFPPSTGILVFRGNTASTKGNGIDLNLNSNWFNKKFKWSTSVISSWVRDRVVDYEVIATAASYIEYGNGYLTLPLTGKPLYALYSYQWAGLDPATGDPMGYLNGVPSKDYAKIKAATTTANMVYNGPSRPTSFGALRNNFSYGNLTLSVNLNYRFGYYVRKASIVYGSTLGLGGHGDYSNRWQKPGDEINTSIPSIPAVGNANRDNFYTYSSALVFKGDHIRLQDVSLSYVLPVQIKSSIKQLRLTLLTSNVALLWKKSKTLNDPDFMLAPQLRTYSANLNFKF